MFTLYSKAASDSVSTEVATSRADIIEALRTILTMLLLLMMLLLRMTMLTMMYLIYQFRVTRGVLLCSLQ